ncbi:MAG: aldehyde dehydrogenase family protein [Puniceicoccales bacterium]|jgi:acetaldehyde dehydrogenase/alcohol dehydrogenase|nr:aldehyde dehydrogenase family protein [Puniceicoccales bacterium]
MTDVKGKNCHAEKVAAHGALELLIKRASAAQARYATFSQEAVDKIFHAGALAASKASAELAEMAVKETGMGVVADKVIKNRFACEFIYERYKDTPTCGIIPRSGFKDAKVVVSPLGLIAGIIPTTNPTSTAIFKALLALKTRNGIIISPHPRATQCTIAAARVVLEAAVEAGAPTDIIGWVNVSTLETTNALMHHPSISAILATGGPGMVKAAYSSGKPALGVGPGNTPAIIDDEANVTTAVANIIRSKTFDHGMICASEQCIIAHADIYEDVKKELVNGGAHILSSKESTQIGAIILKDGSVNAAIVGQSAHIIAKSVGIDVFPLTTILVSEEKSLDVSNPYAHEKLSPILALYRAKDFSEAMEMAVKIIALGGAGHTSVLHTNTRNTHKLEYFANQMPTGRLLINAPATQGAIGLCNVHMTPSLMLGCGSWGGNSISENVGIEHLLNHKILAEYQGDLPIAGR